MYAKLLKDIQNASKIEELDLLWNNVCDNPTLSKPEVQHLKQVINSQERKLKEYDSLTERINGMTVYRNNKTELKFDYEIQDEINEFLYEIKQNGFTDSRTFTLQALVKFKMYHFRDIYGLNIFA